MDPKTYKTVEEVLASEDFQKYLDKDPEVKKAWDEYGVQDPAFKEILTSAINLIGTLKFSQIDSDIVKKKEIKIWNQINQNLPVEEVPSIEQAKTIVLERRNKTRKYISIAAIAASIILPIIIILGQSGNEITTANKEHLAHTLPDGSKVDLNAQTSVAYNDKSWNQNRTLNLDGEAYFRVKKGEKFVVNTAQGSVSVLGTSFNVISRDNYFDVACNSGKVQVDLDGKSYILTEGMAISKYEGAIEERTFDSDVKIPWLRAQADYSNKSLSTVFGELKRQYDVDVDYPEDISSLKYTGQFSFTNLDSAIYQICWPMKLECQLESKVLKVIPEE